MNQATKLVRQGGGDTVQCVGEHIEPGETEGEADDPDGCGHDGHVADELQADQRPQHRVAGIEQTAAIGGEGVARQRHAVGIGDVHPAEAVDLRYAAADLGGRDDADNSRKYDEEEEDSQDPQRPPMPRTLGEPVAGKSDHGVGVPAQRIPFGVFAAATSKIMGASESGEPDQSRHTALTT
jgi:hypothetical protein